MPSFDCTYPGCIYNTGEHDKDVALQFLVIHGHSHAQSSPQNAHPPLSSPQVGKTETIKRPTITLGITSEKFDYFSNRWKTLKKLTNIGDSNAVAHLIECCEEELRIDLYRIYGIELENEVESKVLEAIKKVAVKMENVIVARVRLLNMKQDRDEPVRNFVAKLKGQASTCKYVKKHKCSSCEHETELNYSEDMVRDVLARGLVDNEIQIDLLGDPNQDMPLDQMVNLIEAKETGKESAMRLSGNQSANALHSTYRRGGAIPKATDNKTTGNSFQHNNSIICRCCGKKGHGNSRFRAQRKGVCPAFGHTCTKCNKPNHFDNMCRSNLQNRPAASAISNFTDLLLTSEDPEGAQILNCNASSHE